MLADALSDEIELFETSATDKHESSESIVEDNPSSLVNSESESMRMSI